MLHALGVELRKSAVIFDYYVQQIVCILVGLIDVHSIYAAYYGKLYDKEAHSGDNNEFPL